MSARDRLQWGVFRINLSDTRFLCSQSLLQPRSGGNTQCGESERSYLDQCNMLSSTSGQNLCALFHPPLSIHNFIWVRMMVFKYFLAISGNTSSDYCIRSALLQHSEGIITRHVLWLLYYVLLSVSAVIKHYDIMTPECLVNISNS